jgi:ketosteroid isomerase-like protein
MGTDDEKGSVAMAREADGVSEDTEAIRMLIERWAQAVCEHDYRGILVDHDPDIVMFDVPPPMRSRGIDAYRRTWDLFFTVHRPSDAFDILEIEVTAGRDVAFAVAMMRCGGPSGGRDSYPLDFRLTVGLRKVGGRWRVVHEHHSVPAN